MKNVLAIIILCIVFNTKSKGIDRYSKGDSLSIWTNKLNLRKERKQDSEIINQISNGNWVVVLESKFDKNGDQQLFEVDNSWKDIITGKYVKVKYGDQIGYLFDAYLGKYDLIGIKGAELYSLIDTVRVPDYEIYTREINNHGIIREKGIGMEWSKLIYLIPDISLEEAILLVKQDCIDFKYDGGKQTWIINKEEGIIEMEETDGISWRKLAVKRIENYIVIKLEDGV